MPTLINMTPRILLAAMAMATALLSGCDPHYNWRDFHSQTGAYSVLFPAKPEALTRTIQLDGSTVSMTMEGVEIDGISFTVGSVEMADAVQAEAALGAMRTALVRNINGTVQTEHRASSARMVGGITQRETSLTLRASGTQHGAPLTLIGHFSARDRRVYQVIVLGPQRSLPADQVDMFMGSFHAN